MTRLFGEALAPDLGFLTVAHFDHGLRPSSSHDAEFVAQLAQELGLSFRTHRLKEDFAKWVKTGQGERPPWLPKTSSDASSSPDSQGLQARARAVRYGWLTAVSEEEGCSHIALGHTLEDQAETVLLRLLRGAGAKGLSAMRSRGPGLRWRPLLSTRRSELRSYLTQTSQTWCEDPSNQNEAFDRIQVRQKALPMLEEIRPGVVKVLARSASLFASDEAYLKQQAKEQMQGAAVFKPPHGISVPLDVLAAMHPSVKNRSLRMLHEEIFQKPLPFEAVDSIVKILESRKGLFEFSGGATFTHQGALRIWRKFPDPWIASEGIPLATDLKINLPDSPEKLVVTVCEPKEQRPGFRMRHPAPKDRFFPFGLQGKSKRLARYLRDRGLDRLERSRAVVLAQEDHVLAVLGHERCWDFPTQELEFCVLPEHSPDSDLGLRLVFG